MSTPILPGFSLANRWIFYTSTMLAPAQALAGFGSNWPSNIGLLAYNIYQQLHALSLVPVYLNMMLPITYAGGVPAGNRLMVSLLCVATIGLIITSTLTAWVSWRSNLPEGDGEYQFPFFGSRTLNKGWRMLFLVWGICNTLSSLGMIISVKPEEDEGLFGWVKKKIFLLRATAICWGAVGILILVWPFIYWMESIVKWNRIVSDTDMISVYLFVAQVVVMIVPTVFHIFRC
ncbi:hypothetical protein FA13DRAFT_1755853 [Coprinellus micaceus]|uniref:Uncharacterized protein n=1 Tax=Coprinellus micaceus TaxID=71717 RepID=A0A4Y7T2E3_COPMI|nr:hypothetical protein FA13DRAFT_1755853 [Coprinellus micaceus]